MLTRTPTRTSPKFSPSMPWTIALGLCLGGATGHALALSSSAPPAGYQPCATEGQKCSFSGTANVVYGAGTAWTSPRSFTNGAHCGNAVFGDPLWGVQKVCHVSAPAPAPMPAPAPAPVLGAPPPGFVLCAVEGQPCSFTGTAKVVYGAGTAWTAPRAFTNGVACDNATFGDPLRQVKKACYASSPVAAPAPTPTPAPAPAPAPAPVPAGAVTYHFSDCQAGAAAGCVPGSNANPGTQAAPKQNLAGINANTLPAGSQLLFQRGGAWTGVSVELENPNAAVATPLTFDAYGSGAAPVLQQGVGNMFHIGGGWGNQTNDGGYVIRNLKLDGMGTAEWGVWFVQNVHGVTLEDNEFTGFRIAINSNDGTPHGVSGITLRNNHIHHNRAMGLLGHYNDLLIEGNLIEANNFSGSGFDHGTYIGGGHNITIRNNRYIRNSVVNGVCQGGNMTFHGQIDGLLIEGNRIEQDAGAPGCWLMSITQGYSTAEWFRNAVVRNNKLINGGNTAMAVQSAPGIVVEGNVAINTQATFQTGFFIGSGPGPYQDGDLGDSNAVVRNNTACKANANASGPVTNVNSHGAIVTNNTEVTGAAATTGVCAR